MEYLKLLNYRRSCRKFTPENVDNKTLNQIMQAALTAPSSKSSRSSRFVVVTNKEILKKMAVMRTSGSAFIADAPMAIIVAGDNSLTDLWIDNCAISTTLLQLAISDASLGSCWVHVHSRLHNQNDPKQGSVEDYLRSIIELPENWSVACVVALGHIDEMPRAKKQYDDSDKVIMIE